MFLFHSFGCIEKNINNFEVFICTFITFMISERVLLSSVVDILMIIFQKKKTEQNFGGDIEK